MNFISKLFQNKTVRNSGWLIGGKLAQLVISLVVSLITARYLGPSNYGLISYASSYTAFFTAFCTLGINSLLVKELVDNPEQEGQVLGTSMVLQGISSLLSAVTIVCVVSLIDRDEPTTILVTALCSLGLLFTACESITYWFQRHLKAKFTAIATFAAYVITAVYRLVLVISGKSVTWFALATSVDLLAVAVLQFIFYKKNHG